MNSTTKFDLERKPKPRPWRAGYKWHNEEGFVLTTAALYNEDLSLESRCALAKTLIATGCPMNYDTSEAAARTGNLDMLKHLFEINCPIDEWVCAIAAGRGDFVMLRWAIEAGCPWDGKTMDYMVKEPAGSEIYQWIAEKWFPKK